MSIFLHLGVKTITADLLWQLSPLSPSVTKISHVVVYCDINLLAFDYTYWNSFLLVEFWKTKILMPVIES